MNKANNSVKATEGDLLSGSFFYQICRPISTIRICCLITHFPWRRERRHSVARNSVAKENSVQEAECGLLLALYNNNNTISGAQFVLSPREGRVHM